MKRIGLLLILILLLTGCSGDTSGAVIGEAAFDFQVETHDGNLVNLSDYSGQTVYVLAWATT
jgi:PBP1b-binding outer membrane lipoprotein LpoB